MSREPISRVDLLAYRRLIRSTINNLWSSGHVLGLTDASRVQIRDKVLPVGCMDSRYVLLSNAYVMLMLDILRKTFKASISFWPSVRNSYRFLVFMVNQIGLC